MRIERSNPWNNIEPLNAESTQQAKRENPGETTGSSADKAELSPEASLASGLINKLGDVPDVRGERVAQLRASIQQGTYSVSDSQIADAMFSDLNQRMGR